MIRTSISHFKPVDHDPFLLPGVEQVIPAIEPQIEIFTACLMGGEDASRCYNESISLLLSGDFNQQAMLRALQEIVKRHEALRSYFSSDGLQVFVKSILDLNISFHDLANLSEPGQQKFISDFKNREALTSFDLLSGPLFRVSLFKLKDDEHYLTFSAHHIICDGWSLGIIMQDLSKIYSGYVKGEQISLSKAPAFSEYAIEQSKFGNSEEYRKIEKYWIDLYKDSIPVLSVPTDYPRPSMRTYNSERQDFGIDPQLLSAIKTLSVQGGCSFVTTLLSLFKFYLHRLTNQDDIVVGLPAAGQSITANYHLVGHCANLLPLPSRTEGEESFSEFLKRQKALVLDAFDHQRFTFGSLLQKLQVSRDPSRIPLVPVVFNVDMGMDDGVFFEGLRHQYFSNPRAYEAFEIFVNASGSDKQMVLEWSYNTNLFKSSTIGQMMIGFEDLIRTVAKNPNMKLKDIVGQQNATLGYLEECATNSDYAKKKLVHELVSEMANEYSNNIAVYFAANELTYKELNETANQLAGVLLQHGIQVGDIVSIALERSDKMVLALLAIMKSGAAYLPVDPLYPKERVEFMLQDASPKIILTSKKFQGIYKSTAKEIIIEDIWPELQKFSKKDIEVNVKGSDLVYILYTSGSTGLPKGVNIAHQNLTNFLFSFHKTLGITELDKVLGLTTLSFDISGLEIYLPLTSGASVNIISSQVAKDGHLLLETIKSSRPSIVQATPATWQLLLEAGWDEKVTIQTICSGGEALTMDLAKKLVKRCRSLYNLYGPTETTIWSTVKKISGFDEVITIGHPIENTQVYILDNKMVQVAKNSIGEIYIAGDGVSKGYFNRPELTRERFVNNPFSSSAGDKIYRTGDLGRILPNGEIECLGRVDQQIKVRGFRIEPGEIEHCLLQQNDIKASVVVSREDRQGDQRLVAYVVPRDVTDKPFETSTNRKYDGSQTGSVEVSEEQLKRWKQSLRDFLPSYMIPNDFVIIESLPLTPNGKVDKKALPVPDFTEFVIDDDASPTNELEASLINIWKRLLRIQRVGIHDNFFELGGHSLLAMRLITAIRAELSVEVPLIDIFESTIQSLAKRIQSLPQPGNLTPVKSQASEGHLAPVYGLSREKEFEHIISEWGMTGKGRYLIPIQKDGTRIPFVGIISFNSYRLLSKFMPGNQPLYYLPPTMSASVEVIAAHYIQELKQVKPFGPYCVGGFCEAGTVAFEMARQLEAQGDEVSALILFEYYSTHAAIPKKSFTYIKRRLSYFTNRLFLIRKENAAPLSFVKEVVKNTYSRSKGSLLKFGPPKFIVNPEYKKYSFKPYSGKVILFKAGNPPLDVNNCPLMGWSRYFTGDVEVITIDGGHLGIFREPAIRNLSKKLNVVFDEVNEESKSKIMKQSFLRHNFPSIRDKKALP